MEAMIDMAMGPAGAAGVMAMVIYGAWTFLNNVIVPRVDGMIKDNNERYKEIFAAHQQDREVWLKSIDKIADRLDKMSEVTTEMSKTVEGLHKTVTAITQMMQVERKP